MKAEDVYIGAEVYSIDDGFTYRFNVVAVPDADGNVAVKPNKDSYARGDEIETYHLDNLALYEPREVKLLAGKMQEKIDEAKKAFEVAFNALHEVRDFRSEDGTFISRHDLHDLELINLDDLEDTIERAGWSSSSLWC